MRLKDKCAIVTGGACGIGKAISSAFCVNGANVVIADINIELAETTAAEFRLAGGSCLAVAADVSDKQSVSEMVEIAMRTYGKVDILVNNAGVMHTTPLEDISVDEWNRITGINLTGVFLCCQSIVSIMQANGGGRIINMSSNAGRDGGHSTGLAYSASKAGVIGLSRGIAKRYAHFGITCNCIAPGTTRSDMMDSYTPQMLDGLKKSMPLGRFGEPCDIAELAVFLAGEHGGFVTGAVYDINGGLFIG